jgi:hypothetical protein
LIHKGASLSRDNKGLTKQELTRAAYAHLLVDQENPIHRVYYSRSRDRDGTFKKIDTSNKRTVPQILDDLISANEHEASLQKFFTDVRQLLHDNKFVDDFQTIATEAPEMTEDFITKAYAHVGDTVNQKSLTASLHIVMNMKEIPYHANAWADDRQSVYIISRQSASQKTDESKRKTDGEKSDFNQYLTMVQVAVIGCLRGWCGISCVLT